MNDSLATNIDPVDWDRLAQLADEFAGRLRAGERPSIESFVQAAPELASQIHELFPTIAIIEQVPPDAHGFEQAGSVIGAYKLLEPIGEGAFGSVYMAQQQSPVRRHVAVKILKAGMDTKQVIARFEAERQALALMEHPNIAKVFDGGVTAAGRSYFVMELVRGVAITDYADANKLSPVERIELFIQVCHAVQHAHIKGVIHRDLKPSNILVTHVDGRPVAKVIDFGVAKAIEAPLTDRTLFTHFAQLVGTPLYMSPEQAQLCGLDIDTRADVYSLGVLLYELLTGLTPFDRERFRAARVDEVRRILREEEPQRPSIRLSSWGEKLGAVADTRSVDAGRLHGLLRGELDWIVVRALEKDRNRRYSTAEALAVDLEHYLRGEPVEACPPSFGYRFRKLISRHRRALAQICAALAIGAAMLTATAAYVGYAIGDRQAEQARLRNTAQQTLAEARQSLEDGDWAEANGTLRQAEAVLVAANEPALDAEFARLKSDLELARQLESIRADRSFESYAADDRILPSLERRDQRYREAFRAAGIEEEQLPRPRTRQRLFGSPVRQAIVAAIDDWALGRLRRAGSENTWRSLFGLTAELDDDPKRGELRTALVRRDRAAASAAIKQWTTDQLRPETAILAADCAVYFLDFTTAVEVLRRCHVRYPGDFWVNYHLANDYLMFDIADEPALSYATAAVALRSDLPVAHELLARSLLNVERPREALESIEEALRLEKDSPGALLTQSQIQMALGRSNQALASAERALQLAPNEHVCELQLMSAELAANRLAEAKQLGEACVKRYPNDPESHYQLARTYAALGDWANCAAMSRKAVDLRPVSAQFHEMLAVALGHLGKRADATAAIRASVALRPDDPELRVRALIPYLLAHNWHELADDVREVWRICSDDSVREAHKGDGALA